MGKIKRVYLYDVLLIVVVLTMAYAIVGFFRGSLLTSLEERSALQAELGAKEAFSEVENIERVAQFLGRVIPADRQKSELTTLISQMATSSQLEIAKIDLLETTGQRVQSAGGTPSAAEKELEGVPYRKDVLTVTVVGVDDSVHAFIQRLQDLDRLIDIDTIGYTVDPNVGRVTANIVANVYYK